MLLLNTKWVISDAGNSFVHFTLEFQGANQASITLFDRGSTHLIGTWTEENSSSFTLNYGDGQGTSVTLTTVSNNTIIKLF